VPDVVWRIGDRATFEALRRTKIRARQGPVWMARVPADGEDRRVRVAYSVGRKVGPAVRRNKIRRRLRMVMGALARSGSLAPGAYLVSAGPGAGQIPFAELTGTVARLVDRISGHRGTP
jgi:ribonuclease P protein component